MDLTSRHDLHPEPAWRRIDADDFIPGDPVAKIHVVTSRKDKPAEGDAFVDAPGRRLHVLTNHNTQHEAGSYVLLCSSALPTAVIILIMAMTAALNRSWNLIREVLDRNGDRGRSSECVRIL